MSGRPLNEDERNSIPVPLPTEVPPPPDLSSLPSHILHSGTVETLIGQNEDLMSRLKVNIRRNSILEQQILEQERVNAELTRVNNSLMSQLQVLQEKSLIWQEKSSRVDSQQTELQSQIRSLSHRLSESESARSELSRKLKLEQNFRRRVRSWIRPLLDQLKDGLSAANNRLASRDAQVSDLRARLAETVTQIRNQEKQFTKDQSRLVEQYETQQKSLRDEVEKMRTEIKSLREKAQHVDDAIASKAESENRIVYLERRNEELEQIFQNEFEISQTQLDKYRKEAKVLAIETLEYDRRLNETLRELNELREAHSRLQDQFESLQAVWSDSQKRLESSKIQHEALNRLNQELSKQLKDLRKIKDSSSLPSTKSTPPTPTVTNDSRIAKIESLLVELESGFAMSREPDAQKIHEMEMIETSEKNKNNEAEI